MRALALGLALAAHAAYAYCPCYTLSSSANTYNCGIEAAPGTNPSPTQWQAIFDLVARGPSAWGTQGPAVGNIGAGCNKPTPPTQVAAKFPCELLKAITMQESSWKQFCVPDRPMDQVGKSSRTIISFDCGYGIGQVTSGMHKGENPNFDRARVASDPTYNLATGTLILAEKWRYTQCVGDNQPTVLEHWYTATWAYNGLAYVNNPSNPAYSSTRGIYNPSAGGSRPYAEKVFGWMEYPPTPSHWSITRPAYPNPAMTGSSGAPPALPDPSCSTPTNCATTRPLHTSSCFGGNPTDGGTGGGAGTGGGSAAGGGAATGGGSAGGGSAGGGAAVGGGAATGGGSAAGGGAATGGGSAMSDAGINTNPIVLDAAPTRLGAAPEGCGCNSVPASAGFLLGLLGWLRRRRSMSR